MSRLKSQKIKAVRVARVTATVSEGAYGWDSYEKDAPTFGAEPGAGEVVIGEWADEGYVALNYGSLNVGEATHPLHIDEDGLWVVANETGVNRKLVGKRFTDVFVSVVKVRPERRRFLITCQRGMSNSCRWYGRETTPGGSWWEFGATRDEVVAKLDAHLRPEPPLSRERVTELRAALDDGHISYGELAEIDAAFEQIDPATLPDAPENAMADDKLAELEALLPDVEDLRLIRKYDSN